jgi:hypothetical protein
VFAMSRDIILMIGVILRLRDAPADVLGRVVVAADLGFSAGMIIYSQLPMLRSEASLFTLCGLGVSSSGPNHQALSCGFHDLTCDRVQRVDLHETCNLADEPVEHAKVAPGNANHCREGFLVVSLELWGLLTCRILLCRGHGAVCSRTLVKRLISSMGFQEGLDRACAFLQRVAQCFAPVIVGLDDLPEGNSIPCKLGANRPTEKPVLMKDTDLGH